MLRRSLGVVGLIMAGMLALVLLAGPASAGEYPPPPDVQDTTAETTPTTVAAAAALPRTGSSSTEGLVRTGAVLVVAGGVLVYAVRRRQHATDGS